MLMQNSISTCRGLCSIFIWILTNITKFNHTWPIDTKTGIIYTVPRLPILFDALTHIYIPCVHAGPMECCYGRLWRMERCHWKIWMSKTLLTGLRMDLWSTRGNVVAKIGDLPDCACCQFLMHTATAGSCTHSLGMRLSRCHARFRVSTSYSLVCIYSSIPPSCSCSLVWYYKSQILYSHVPLWTSLIACSCFLTSTSIFAAEFTFLKLLSVYHSILQARKLSWWDFLCNESMSQLWCRQAATIYRHLYSLYQKEIRYRNVQSSMIR